MSSQVGSGHISIFPVMTGFKARVSKETKSAGAAGAKTFEGGFKGAGAKAGRFLGRDLKSSLASAAGNLGAAEISKLNRSVEAASVALSKARLKQQDEAGRVRVAEVRLAEAVAKNGAESAQAVAAEERLAATRRRQEQAANAVAAATTRLKGAQDVLSAATLVNTAASSRFGDSLVAVFSNLRAGFADARAGQSAFTGLAGSIGGIVKELLILGRNVGAGSLGLMRLAARQAYTGFTSLAALIGGGLAKAFSRPARAVADFGARALAAIAPIGYFAVGAAGIVGSSFRKAGVLVVSSVSRAASSAIGRLQDIGASVSDALAPIRYFAVGAGQILATPFVQLGTRVAGFIRPIASSVGSAFASVRSQIASHLAPVTAQVSALFAKITGVGGPAAQRLVSAFRGGLAGLGSAAASGLQSVVSAAQRAGSAAGQALSAGLKNTATAGVAAAGVALGISLGAGFSRLNAIDTARAKLTGLGKDGQTVAQIMQNANNAVTGTAFGLGEAATVAAGAVAAQIKPGEQLQAHLKNVANNAAAAGTSFQDMGSIFNRAATQANGVQNDIIGQLGDKGIPIYEELGKVMGVTAGEVFKLASEGKVSFEQFSQAAEAAAGTVAEQIGKTVPGALANLKARLGRIGAGIFGGINQETGEMYGLYARLGPLLASVNAALAPLQKSAEGFGATLDRVLGPGIERITGWLTNFAAASERGESVLGGLGAVIAPIGAAFAALGAGGLATLLSRIPLLAGLLGGLTGPLALLGGPLGVLAAAFAGFALSGADAGALVSGITGIVDSVVAALPGLVSQIATFVPQLLTAILAQVPALLSAGVQIIDALIQGIVTALPVIATGAVQLLTGLITAIVAALPMLITGAIALVTALIQGIITALPLLVTAAITLVTGLLTAIVANLPTIIQGGLQLLIALVQGILNALPQLISAALDLVITLLDTLISNLPMIIDAGIELLLSLVTGLIGALPQLITAAINLILQLVIALLTMLPKLIEAGIELIVALIVGLVQAIPKIIEMLPQIVEAIWNGLIGVDWLDLGFQIVMGIINGLVSAGGALLDAIIGLASSAFEGFKDFFGIASPAKRMIQPGRDVVRGAEVGVGKEQRNFEDSMSELAKAGAARFEAQIGGVSATVTAGVTSSRGSATPSSGGTGHTADAPSGGIDLRGAQITSVDVPGTIRALQTESARARARHGGRVVTG